VHSQVVATPEFDYILLMHRLRKSPRSARWLLALSLLLSPLLVAWQGGAVAAAPPASVHEHHHIMPVGSHGLQHATTPASNCAQDHCQDSQHDTCHGSCCMGCGHCTHCAGAFDLAVSLSVPAQAILTPHVTRLLSSSFPTLRERPPRVLSA